jgi:hypothetical protein
MKSLGKVCATALLAIISLASAICAAYLLSILWQGRWRYPVVAVAFSASTLIAVLAIVGVAVITRRGQSCPSAVRRASYLVLTYSAISGTSFFLLLANCSLSCGNRILAEAKSPNGNWKAVWFLRQCASPAQYCPPISFVSVLSADAQLPNSEGNAFSVVADDGIRLDWKADDLLQISYPGFVGVNRSLRQQHQVGDIRVKYLPIGFM